MLEKRPPLGKGLEKTTEPYKVISVTGKGLSGSTILCHILGAHPQVVNIGEINNLKRAMKLFPEKLCSDGVILGKHPVWKQVLKNYDEYGFIEPPDLKYYGDRQQFISANKATFEGIVSATGKRIIVETCKNSKRVIWLKRLLGTKIEIVHLIRDPRAYAFSTRKRKKYKLIPKLLNWNLKAIVLYTYKRIGNMSITEVRYEDLLYNTPGTVQKIFNTVGLEYIPDQLRYYNTKQPVFWGNKEMLNKKDELELRDDYIRNLNSFSWLFYTLICFPSVLLYRYPILKYSAEEEFYAQQ